MGQSESAPLPVREKDPTHDPLYGFQKGRKEREMKVTPEEMEAMKVPLDERTYCAHHYIYYNTCRNSVWPLAYRCAKEKHAYEKCLYEDFVLRMKEYERERRLLERDWKREKRQKRLQERQGREELVA